jgi:hypothetical protein
MPSVAAAKLSPLLHDSIVDNGRPIGAMASLDVTFSLSLGSGPADPGEVTDQDELARWLVAILDARPRIRDDEWPWPTNRKPRCARRVGSTEASQKEFCGSMPYYTFVTIEP